MFKFNYEIYTRSIPIGIIESSYIKYIPWLIGSERKYVLKKLGFEKPIKSINIPIEQVELTDDLVRLEVIKEQISHKLVIDTCSSVHAILKFWTEAPSDCYDKDTIEEDEEGFYIKALSPMNLNTRLITKKDGYHRINQYDSIHFPWEVCTSKFDFPNQSSSTLLPPNSSN